MCATAPATEGLSPESTLARVDHRILQADDLGNAIHRCGLVQRCGTGRYAHLGKFLPVFAAGSRPCDFGASLIGFSDLNFENTKNLSYLAGTLPLTIIKLK